MYTYASNFLIRTILHRIVFYTGSYITGAGINFYYIL